MRPLAAIVPLACLALFATAIAPPAAAQRPKPGRDYHEDAQSGYRFKPLADWAKVPPQPMEADRGLVLRMAGPDFLVPIEGNRVVQVDSEMVVLRVEGVQKERTSEKAQESGRTESVVLERPPLDGLLPMMLNRFRMKREEPDLDEDVKLGRKAARHRVWEGMLVTNLGVVPGTIDAWTFVTAEADFHLVWAIPNDDVGKWQKTFERSAKTFEEIERLAADSLPEDASYEEIVDFYQRQEEGLGWRAVPTPSKKYVIKTSSDDDDFVEEVIQRLEASREIYERDFPPSKKYDHVSVVRICATEEQFHQYGGTGGGVAGWFNPGTTELVLYDAKDIDRNMTFAVMSHEAFHQYCHFLFGQSEAHRWFDEGHGDYYGGVEFKYGRAEITKHMPAGLDRLGRIKQMVRERVYVPMEEHIHFDHPTWQNKGIDSYCQSWSLIYFLRQGMLGEVPGKYWKPRYAKIVPTYIETLTAAYQEIYDEIRAERADHAKGLGRDLTPAEAEVTRRDLSPDQREAVWKKAMDAAWGDVDMAEFEDDWASFVAEQL